MIFSLVQAKGQHIHWGCAKSAFDTTPNLAFYSPQIPRSNTHENYFRDLWLYRCL